MKMRRNGWWIGLSVVCATLAGVGCRPAVGPAEDAVESTAGAPTAHDSSSEAAGESSEASAQTGNVYGVGDTIGAETEPADGDWLVQRLGAEMKNLNPYTTNDASSADVNVLIFETLVELDNETFAVKPLLAKSWEISEDHLSYTFHLREEAAFSDGEPVRADDVKFSFDTAMNPAVNAPHLRNYLQDITQVEVVDPLTVRFTCTKPYFRHLVVIGSTAIIPKHKYETGDFNTHELNRSPLGSGPYRFERWVTNQEVVLVRNENYWGEKPHILRRVLKIITNDDSAFTVLTKNEIDQMSLTPELWMTRADTAEFDADFNKIRFRSPSYNYIGWNMRRDLFKDQRVRLAMTMLMDRELILDELLYGLAVVTSGNFFVNEPEYNKEIEPWPFAPQRAAELLTEAGWTDSDNDGILDRAGMPFRFQLLMPNSAPVYYELIATIFQEELERAGIEMSIRTLEWATFLENVNKHEFDACMLAWRLVPYPDPYQVWHSSQAVEDGSNHVGFVNEEADRIMEQARTTFDHAKRIELYHRFHEIVHQEQPYTFLFCRDALYALDKRFANVAVYPIALDPAEWWVPQAEQRYP